ncbi:hypothetical protein ABZ851_27320 [Streptomyces sp. NPDC047049]|uniref:hypothetical protein n=1 Tax=Streptomyces sp. NPDC047049 TaxID=3156688 RepID=UPI0033E7EF4B
MKNHKPRTYRRGITGTPLTGLPPAGSTGQLLAAVSIPGDIHGKTGSGRCL